MFSACGVVCGVVCALRQCGVAEQETEIEMTVMMDGKTQLFHPIQSHVLKRCDPSYEDMTACTYAYARRRKGVNVNTELRPASYSVCISRSLSIHTSISIAIGLYITADDVIGMHHSAPTDTPMTLLP